MADAMEIIISAVDSASEVFQSIISSATGMADGITGAVDDASATFDMITENVSGFSDAVSNVDTATLTELADELGLSTEEVERLIAAGADMGTLSAGFNEASVAADELEQEIQDDIDKMAEFGSAGDVMAAQTFMDMANGMKDSMLGMADSAGTFNDSMMRASLEAEGAGVSVDEMKSVVSSLADETGRAGGQIRESYIKSIARGVTDMDSFKTMMEGAGAQATLFGTDIQTMADKFSGLAFNANLMPRALKETGITMDELATAMGDAGMTADEVKAKWKELDTNQRAAILGQAASMNEGKSANDEYKHSWAGLQEQMEIAKGRLERIVGSVLLPVLIPAMQLAGSILNGVGDVISAIMAGPLGGLVSVLGTLGGVFMIAVAGAAALRNFIAFLKIETLLETAATWLNTAAKIANAEGSTAAGLGNAILSGGFMTSAAAAWSAAVAFLAATWPLWVIVGVAALVVAAVYEIGKAFGWWSDVGGMIDHVKDGLTRLWEAFINHPDVQAVLGALAEVWSWLSETITAVGQAILDFFGINESGEFDVVRALIDGIGNAWNMVKSALDPVITAVMGVINAFNQFRAGQIDLPTLIFTVLSTIVNLYITIWSRIIGLVASFGSQMVSRGVSAASRFVSGIVGRIAALPGQVGNRLHNVISHIASAMAAWIITGVAKAGEFVSQIPAKFSELPGRIASALSGVIDAITSPFKQAYDSVVGVVDSIKSKVEEGINAIANLGAKGGDLPDARGGDIVSSNNPVEIEHNLNISLDLNAPSHINTEQVINALTDRDVLRALTDNRDFQLLDGQAKAKLNLKINRARGI